MRTNTFRDRAVFRRAAVALAVILTPLVMSSGVNPAAALAPTYGTYHGPCSNDVDDIGGSGPIRCGGLDLAAGSFTTLSGGVTGGRRAVMWQVNNAGTTTYGTCIRDRWNTPRATDVAGPFSVSGPAGDPRFLQAYNVLLAVDQNNNFVYDVGTNDGNIRIAAAWLAGHAFVGDDAAASPGVRMMNGLWSTANVDANWNLASPGVGALLSAMHGAMAIVNLTSTASVPTITFSGSTATVTSYIFERIVVEVNGTTVQDSFGTHTLTVLPGQTVTAWFPTTTAVASMAGVKLFSAAGSRQDVGIPGVVGRSSVSSTYTVSVSPVGAAAAGIMFDTTETRADGTVTSSAVALDATGAAFWNLSGSPVVSITATERPGTVPSGWVLGQSNVTISRPVNAVTGLPDVALPTILYANVRKPSSSTNLTGTSPVLGGVVTTVPNTVTDTIHAVNIAVPQVVGDGLRYTLKLHGSPDGVHSCATPALATQTGLSTSSGTFDVVVPFGGISQDVNSRDLFVEEQIDMLTTLPGQAQLVVPVSSACDGTGEQLRIGVNTFASTVLSAFPTKPSPAGVIFGDTRTDTLSVYNLPAPLAAGDGFTYSLQLHAVAAGTPHTCVVGNAVGPLLTGTLVGPSSSAFFDVAFGVIPRNILAPELYVEETYTSVDNGVSSRVSACSAPGESVQIVVQSPQFDTLLKASVSTVMATGSAVVLTDTISSVTQIGATDTATYELSLHRVASGAVHECTAATLVVGSTQSGTLAAGSATTDLVFPVVEIDQSAPEAYVHEVVSYAALNGQSLVTERCSAEGESVAFAIDRGPTFGTTLLTAKVVGLTAGDQVVFTDVIASDSPVGTDGLASYRLRLHSGTPGSAHVCDDSTYVAGSERNGHLPAGVAATSVTFDAVTAVANAPEYWVAEQIVYFARGGVRPIITERCDALGEQISLHFATSISTQAVTPTDVFYTGERAVLQDRFTVMGDAGSTHIVQIAAYHVKQGEPVVCTSTPLGTATQEIVLDRHGRYDGLAEIAWTPTADVPGGTISFGERLDDVASCVTDGSEQFSFGGSRRRITRLVETGSDSLLLAEFAGGFVLLGVALVLVSRRRKAPPMV
jgi:hypothetical protein